MTFGHDDIDHPTSSENEKYDSQQSMHTKR
jgi:hypothetical protein